MTRETVFASCYVRICDLGMLLPGSFPRCDPRSRCRAAACGERAHPPNVRDRLNTVYMGGALVDGSALADDRPRLPAVSVSVQSVLQGRVCSSGVVRSGDTVPFLRAIRTSLLAPGLSLPAFVAEKLRKISKFLQQALTF